MTDSRVIRLAQSDQTALPGVTGADTPDRREVVRCRKGCEWTGRGACHCSACHQTFTGLTAFDKHRAGVGDGPCRTPDSIGLVHNDIRHMWQFPGNGEERSYGDR